LVKLEKAYVAGIVDGEGTVTLMKHHRNETPIPCVSIANNKLKLLHLIKHGYGGLICSKRKSTLLADLGYLYLIVHIIHLETLF